MKQEEPDEPLALLTEAEDDASADFLQRVMRRVDRRQSAAHMVGFGMDVPKVVLTELVQMLAAWPGLLGGKKGKL